MLAGVVVFLAGYVTRPVGNHADPATLRIVAKIERFRLRYDAARQEFPSVEVC